MSWKRAHQMVGLLVVILFLLTGQFLEIYYPHIEELDQGTRMMLRSRHIYILMAGLINVGVGAYFSPRTRRPHRILQVVGSILIIAGALLSVVAFFYEPQLPNMKRTFTLPVMLSLLAGSLLHLLSGVGRTAR